MNVTKEQAQAQADERVYTEESLGIEIFWDKHKRKILWIIAVCFLAAIAAVVATAVYEKQQNAMQVELASATTQEQLLAVANKYAGTEIAAVARLLVASELRTAGDTAAVDAAFSEITKPAMPATLARLGVAQNAAAAGKADEAILIYREVALAGDNFTAPLARFFEGTETLAQGKHAEARTIFQSILTDFPKSVAARVVPQQLEKIALVEPK